MRTTVDSCLWRSPSGTRIGSAPLMARATRGPCSAPHQRARHDEAALRRADFVEDRPETVDGVVLDGDRVGAGRRRDGDADRIHAGVDVRIADPTLRRARTDFLIVGGGIAGLRAAIALAPAGRVAVLTKADPNESNTGYAQGGIAAAVGDDDSPALHAADTIRAGDGLCDEQAVRVLVEQGPMYVRELLDWGARFERDASGRPALGREAAHSVRRVLHAGDATGREIGRTLWERVSGLPSVETINHALVTELLVEDGRVVGVAFFDHIRRAEGTSRGRDAARNRRRRTGLSRNDESGGRHRRRHFARVSRRRARRRSRVRPVSSDRAQACGRAAVPHF